MNALERKTTEIRDAIQRFVIIDGLVRSVGILGFGFWAILIIDFLPVQFGYSEMPWFPRAVALISVVSLVFWFAKKHLLNRLQVEIPDESLLLLVERQHPKFDDRLLTLTSQQTKGYAPSGDNLDRRQQLLELLEEQIESDLSAIDPKKLLARKKLLYIVLLNLLPIAAMILGGLVFPNVISRSAARTFLLSPAKYDRQTSIETVSFRSIATDERIPRLFPVVDKELVVGQTAFVARHSKLQINVKARSNRTTNNSIRCKLLYRLEDGRSGSTFLQQVLKSRDGKLSFVTQDELFASIDTSGEFWLRIDDASSGPYSFSVIDPPKVTQVKAKVEYPQYLLDSSFFENSEDTFLNNSSFPMGTRVLFTVDFAGESLSDAKIWIDSQQPEGNFVEEVKINTGSVEFHVAIESDQNYLLAAMDDYHLTSTSPYRISLKSIEDRPPIINVSTVGVGSAITKNARLRFSVEGEDEFGIRDGQISTKFTSDEKLGVSPFDWNVEKEKIIAIDLLDWRREGKLQMSDEELEQGFKFAVSIGLSDFNPDHEPTLGQTYEFDVVTEKKFVALIEKEEAGLRKRLEDVYDEFKSVGQLCRNFVTAAERLNSNATLDIIKESNDSIPVYLQQSRLQTQKSSRDIGGISNAFLNLIIQLENNRLTVKTKQLELKEKVEGPLRDFGEKQLGQFLKSLEESATMFGKFPKEPDDTLKSKLIDQAKNLDKRHNELMARFGDILAEIVKFETQNELLDSIRNLIDEHKKLMDATEKERDRKLFEGILD